MEDTTDPSTCAVMEFFNKGGVYDQRAAISAPTTQHSICAAMGLFNKRGVYDQRAVISVPTTQHSICAPTTQHSAGVVMEWFVADVELETTQQIQSTQNI